MIFKFNIILLFIIILLFKYVDIFTVLLRLSEVEKDWKDLESKYLVNKATLNTLQNDLVQEKLVGQQLKASMSRLGLAVDQLADPDSVLDK